MPIEQRLLTIAAGIRAAVKEFSPHVLAVERVFAQHNTSTVMGTAQASGIALLVGAEFGLPAALHTPTEVKAAITGHGGADKKQVQAMVARILRLEEIPKPADAADALALALCHAWRGAPGVRTAGAGATETPAMKAWREAERAAASGRMTLPVRRPAPVRVAP